MERKFAGVRQGLVGFKRLLREGPAEQTECKFAEVRQGLRRLLRGDWGADGEFKLLWFGKPVSNSNGCCGRVFALMACFLVEAKSLRRAN